ncbi:laminin subunit beta-1-like isoform X1 [Neodiprion pinetum]|uniref:Laminin subunit beta-2 n=1 Tax=Neodiprion lecontei TaxID=441921 RepID=A0A6J0B8Y2_NEOLC|nr:laminin subunit beta-1 isoform X1 [Neodiprion lecontei]XP_046482220.1 laminin subunit beta-1-like isoform X1 [Neodiprion pinetum]
MVRPNQLIAIVFGLFLVILADTTSPPYYRRVSNRVQSRPAVVETVQRGDMSPSEAFGENQYSWSRVTTMRPRGVLLKKPQPCEVGSCYPATGDLLIGRENRIRASSTCGLKGPERYCIVSHLQDRKKCFFCDKRIPKQQHGVENIVHKYQPNHRAAETWWQSENGVENVTLQLDLEAEFHFTHIIIKFKTFRPAAMLIERSYDFGKTWQVYKYFAYNCQQSFPGVSTKASRNLTDVVCESRYSNVAPSEGGEIIHRVLPPNLQIDNPYSKEVQNLLKMTNLRINFTRLHTLGDDLLDNRAEIREKYYYAIKNMWVRGSCSCYGHASRCLPLPGIPERQDMVHGRCECTHNTKGLNCEYCEDFFNDLPWKPAVGKQTSACKMCNCNNHSQSCHFDEAVFERSGRVSGGVCDDCQHNTRGQNCEQCKPFFYHESSRDMTDAEACQPCDCDPSGSLDDGICDSRTDELSGDESGRCHCKANVEGRRCDRCKNGFWKFDFNNPDGCQACTCNTVGTIGNQGCNMLTGECTCKRYVTARDCSQCLPEYWGLSEEQDGCKPCDCDLGGAYDNFCDVVTGQCRCRRNIGGRTCNEPEQSYYTVSLDFLIYEGENSRASSNCQIVIREPYRDGRNTTWTGSGFIRAYEFSNLTFVIDDIVKTMEYDIVVRYEPEIAGPWQKVRIFIERDGPVDPDGPCRNWQPSDDRVTMQLYPDRHSAVAIRNACLESGKRYIVHLTFDAYDQRYQTPSASILIDSITLIPRPESIPVFSGSPLAEVRRQEYEAYRCGDMFYDLYDRDQQISDICKQYQYIIGTYVFDGGHACECNLTGSHSLLCNQFGGRCSCKTNVIGRRCDSCAPGTYNFGPEGCKPCDCDAVGALDNFCNVETGRCTCHPNTYSRTCGLCQPGFWNFPHCRRCECNGHADSCDSKTGACINCQDSTTGHNCDMCIATFYGDPRIGVDIPCRQCPCPGAIASGHSYADSCSLDSITQDVVCECYEGYASPRCETCDDNYYGNPDVPGGSCTPCDCSNNTDPARPGNCDPKTGECLQCLFDTAGSHCQICKPQYYGDALEKNCKFCECNVLGTDQSAGPCNHRSGQCPCLPHVMGQFCDHCEENHWRIASGEGCDPCECDAIGSISDKCNEYDGTCECRPGFGGRQCNECQKNHWGDPNIECKTCECSSLGSATPQCDRQTGACVCYEGIGGVKCDHCDRGYLGFAPTCRPCGECFDNWDMTLQGVRNRTSNVITDASRIKKVGITGFYTSEFDQMDDSLNQVKALVSDTSVRGQDLEKLSDRAADLKNVIQASQMRLDELDNLQDSVSQRVHLADAALKNMRNRTDNLHQDAAQLKKDATKLQEANVQGALNVTVEMAEQSNEAERMANGTLNTLAEAERYHTNTENFLSKNSLSFKEATDQNKESIARLGDQVTTIKSMLPDLNLEVCGERVTECSSLCGGAGCGSCGGLSCDAGAVAKVNLALDLADKQTAAIKNHRDKAEQLLRSMSQVQQEAIAARSNAQDAFNHALSVRNKTDGLSADLTALTDRMWNFLTEEQSTPAEVRDLAKKALSKNIHSNPEQIKELAQNISLMVGSLTNPEKIIAEAADGLRRANQLRERANATKNEAIAKEVQAEKITKLLTDAQSAQDNADNAVRKATDDIAQSQAHLTTIIQGMKMAKDTAGKLTASVGALDSRLENLQTQLIKDDYILNEEIAKQVAEVVLEAGTVDNKTMKLRQEYQQAKNSLGNRVDRSKGNIEKAKSLLARASELTADTSTKFKDLDGMEIVYKDNERKLSRLMDIVDSLTNEMEQHLKEIDTKSIRYRQCST